MNSLVARRLRWLGWFLAGILATLLLWSGDSSNQPSVVSASSSNGIEQFMALRLHQPVQSVQAAVEAQINAGC